MILIVHNIVWSKYKGAVFTSLHNLTDVENSSLKFIFVQIAETDFDRIDLNGVDFSYHNYPFKLLFPGSYGSINKVKLSCVLFLTVWNSGASLVLIPGYHKFEFWMMLLASILRGKKRAVFCDSTIYDQPQTLFKGFLKRLFFSFCDGFFSYGLRGRAYLNHYRAPHHKIYHRCQAAALPHNYTLVQSLQLRINLAPRWDSQRFLYVGRLSPEKSIDILLKAFHQIRRSLPNARLVLIGSGPQQQELVKLTALLGLSDVVDFAGSFSTDALVFEYAKASCLVLPSFSEPWGLVVNEALSYGCPVVVSHRCGCVPELVENQPTGFVFEAGNVDDLAAKLSAVPVAFADVEKIARSCLDLISGYSPKNAAENILVGCKIILAGA